MVKEAPDEAQWMRLRRTIEKSQQWNEYYETAEFNGWDVELCCNAVAG